MEIPLREKQRSLRETAAKLYPHKGDCGVLEAPAVNDLSGAHKVRAGDPEEEMATVRVCEIPRR
jgi:hypothetical protein